MNMNVIRESIERRVGSKVIITVYGMRSKIDKYEGFIYKTYSNIFTIKCNGEEKSFPYRDIITKEIIIKYV